MEYKYDPTILAVLAMNERKYFCLKSDGILLSTFNSEWNNLMFKEHSVGNGIKVLKMMNLHKLPKKWSPEKHIYTIEKIQKNILAFMLALKDNIKKTGIKIPKFVNEISEQ